MTYEEWQPIAHVLRTGWNAGQWDQPRSDTYFAVLQDHERAEVMKALRLLMEDGSAYRPSVAQIIAGINRLSDAHLPPWSLVWSGLQHALKYEQGRGLSILETEVHPVVRAFALTEGWTTLQQMPFFGSYGALEIERLRQRWNEFSQYAAERVRQGRTVKALGGGPNRQLRHLSAVAELPMGA